MIPFLPPSSEEKTENLKELYTLLVSNPQQHHHQGREIASDKQSPVKIDLAASMMVLLGNWVRMVVITSLPSPLASDRSPHAFNPLPLDLAKVPALQQTPSVHADDHHHPNNLHKNRRVLCIAYTGTVCCRRRRRTKSSQSPIGQERFEERLKGDVRKI